MSQKDTSSKKKTGLALLAKDLDLLERAIVKRAATLGAVLGFLHHLHCMGH